VEFTDHEGNDRAVGLYRFYDTNSTECVNHFEEDDFGQAEKSARMGGTMAILLACFSLLLMLMEFVCCRCCCSKIFMGLALFLAVIFQGLTFLFFNSDQFCDGDIFEEIRHQKPCSIADGSVYSICASTMYYLALVFMWWTPKPEPLSKQKDIHSSSSHHDDSTVSIPEVIATPVEDPEKSATMA
jgi:hypothetical protein